MLGEYDVCCLVCGCFECEQDIDFVDCIVLRLCENQYVGECEFWLD